MASSIEVKKLTEDSKTVTVGWTPPPGQEGFIPTLNGSEKLIDGKRHPNTSESQDNVKIGKPAGETNPATKNKYGVKILGSIAEGAYDPTKPPTEPPTEPPTQPPTGSYKTDFDGRAVKFTSLPVTGALANPVPPDIWPTASYIHSDITLAPDSRFGKVFHCTLKGGLGKPGDWLNSPKSANPWGESWQQPDSYSCELTSGGGTPYKRTISVGEINWYANSYRLLPGWTGFGFCCVTQYGYPTLASPPFTLSPDQNGLCIVCFPGMLTNGQSQWWDRIVIRPWAPLINHWYDFIFGVKWDYDPKDPAHPNATGWWEAWGRCRDLGENNFIKLVSRQNVATFQYTKDQPWTGIMDKEGIYGGASGVKPESFSMSCDQRGLTRHPTLQDAQLALA